MAEQNATERPRIRLYPEQLALSEARRAIERGHFVYGDGSHGEVWIDTKYLLGRARFIGSCADDLGASFLGQFDVVLGPAVKGIPLAYAITSRWGESAAWLDKKINERGEVTWVIDDCFLGQIKGGKVLLADDVIQTGLTLEVARREVERAGGRVVGAAVIWNRSRKSRFLGEVPLRAVIEKSFEAFRSPFLKAGVFAAGLKECPLCQERVFVNTDYGKGERFLWRLVYASKGDLARELGWREGKTGKS